MVIPWGIAPGLRDEHVATEVADGVYWFSANIVNWYLLEDTQGVTIVDAGLPDHWELLMDGLERLGYELSDVEALLITHADPDHIGMAERLRENGVPVWVHQDDYEAALNGGAELPRRTFVHLWRPSLIRFLRAQMQGGVAATRAVSTANTFTGDEELAVPGRPSVIHVPGHTPGHCAFWLADRKVLLAGDALATVDPLRGIECEPAPFRLANSDGEQARTSVRQLASLGELTLLTGHGKPWNGDLDGTL